MRIAVGSNAAGELHRSFVANTLLRTTIAAYAITSAATRVVAKASITSPTLTSP